MIAAGFIANRLHQARNARYDAVLKFQHDFPPAHPSDPRRFRRERHCVPGLHAHGLHGTRHTHNDVDSDRDHYLVADSESGLYAFPSHRLRS